MKLLTSKAAKT